MSINLEAVDVRNNSAQNRYEANIEDHLAMIEYILRDDVIIFTHTETPPALEGQGVAAKMAQTALDEVSRQGYKIIPYCPYISAYIKRHPRYQPLLLERRQWRENLRAVGL